MIITLSPSKGQDFDTAPLTDFYSLPVAIKRSQHLITALQKINKKSLQTMMSVSENIANLNLARYKTFQTPFTPSNAKQAIFAFKGDVYSHFALEEYNKADYDFAQSHLRILSGLYGCLKPLDLIQPYRLEMKTKLKTSRGDNLYQFWGEEITNEINQALKKQKQAVLINLASNEYFKSVKPKQLEGEILTINFKETKAGKTRVVAIFAKRARGLMANYIIKNKIENTEDIKKFNLANYQFNALLSDNSQWTFERAQPS